MTLRNTKIVAGGLLAAIAGMTATGAPGQEERRVGGPQATIFRDATFRGPSVTVTAANPDLGITWRVNSIRVAAGIWELCEQTRYRAPCRTYSSDTPMMNTIVVGHRVRSMRPSIATGDGGPSMRGISSQYFRQPTLFGQRVQACTTGNANASCTANSANSFCRNLGWGGAAWQTTETGNRAVLLADVLCTQSGR
jgi:hypothetical protein